MIFFYIFFRRIEPSTFLGQSLQAKTRIGIKLISAKVTKKSESHMQNSLSGIPSFRFNLEISRSRAIEKNAHNIPIKIIKSTINLNKYVFFVRI
jgi:hypothetical protein